MESFPAMRGWLMVLVVAAGCKQAPQADEATPAGDVTKWAPVASSPADAAAPVAKAEVEDDKFAGVRNRKLTAGEIALLKPMFRASLDYGKVRVVDGKYIPFQPANTYMTPDGNIYAPGSLYEEDFTADSVSVSLRGVFVHEIAHVWQHISGMDLVMNGISEFFSARGDYGSVYQYKLDKRFDLLDYGFEAQASIVQDYYLLELGRSATHLNGAGLSRDQKRTQYRHVLGKFLADPGYAKALPPAQIAAKQEKARERARAAAKAAAARGEKPKDHPSCGCAWHEPWDED